MPRTQRADCAACGRADLANVCEHVNTTFEAALERAKAAKMQE